MRLGLTGLHGRDFSKSVTKKTNFAKTNKKRNTPKPTPPLKKKKKEKKKQQQTMTYL